MGLLGACIKEDMSQCRYDIEIDYHIHLQNNFQEVLIREFTTPKEVALSEKLQDPLSHIFNESVEDINFSFYAKSNQQYDETYEVNDSYHAHSFFIAAKNYTHFAFANLSSVSSVERVNQSKIHSCHLAQIQGDTISSHDIALYTGSDEIQVQPINSPFSMKLYMQNSACILALDPNGNEVKSIRSYIINTANAFHVKDGIFIFDKSQVISMCPLHTDAMYSMYGVSFPSRGYSSTTRTIEEASDEPSLWKIHAYITLQSGAVTENILSIKKPLRAEDLYIIKGIITAKGEIQSSSNEVGISVNIDWEQGNEYNPEI